MIDLFTLTGQTTFLINSPWLGMAIDLGGGKSLKITIVGGNSDSEYLCAELEG